MSFKKRVTIKQVAAHAEVSPMTVSNYVNKRFDLLSSKMKEKVARSIEELNYKRNFGAHVLRTSQLWSIGLIVVDRSDEYLSDGYTTQIVSGFSNCLNKAGYSMLLQGVKPEEFEQSNIVRNLQTDAIGVMLSGDRESRSSQFREICQMNQPTVLFLEDMENPANEICSIMQDEVLGGMELARVVLRRSPKHVAILVSGENEWASVNRRIEGMRSVLEKDGGVQSIHVVKCGDMSQHDVHAALEQHSFESGIPDSIMCINDYMALSAIGFLKGRGIQVPEQTCVTGFNAFRVHEMSDPTLTTIQSPAYEMGKAGAQALLHCLDKGSFEQRQIKFPASLISGGSA